MHISILDMFGIFSCTVIMTTVNSINEINIVSPTNNVGIIHYLWIYENNNILKEKTATMVIVCQESQQYLGNSRVMDVTNTLRKCICHQHSERSLYILLNTF